MDLDPRPSDRHHLLRVGGKVERLMRTAADLRDPDPPRFVYDARTIALHWLSAIFVAAQWIGGHTIDWFPRGALRTEARSVHLLTGAALAALILVRIHWRYRGGRRAPRSSNRVLEDLSRLLHLSLYGLLLTAIVLGIGNAWVRGDSLFGLFTLPRPFQSSPSLRRAFATGHSLLAYAIAITVTLHAVAAFAHAVFGRDGVMSRMLPVSRGG
ncbi:cytochrome b [Caulobacter sp. KR2-114]|uniref:cytochrome b n=1 Tax=Caulobacter sp. KR2-114 TaxID=3400912 RepID=UPI003C0BA302